MGRDKATIEIDGIPLIRRIYDVVAGCRDVDEVLANSHADRLCHRIHVITPWETKYQSILPATCHFISEKTPDRGPPIAFEQGLSEITSTWVLLLACDLPNLSTPLLQSWIDRLPSVPPQSIAYLPQHADKGWEPLCGFYRQSCHHSLHEYLDGGGRSFQGWLQQNVVTALAIADPICLANCNTPEDLATVVENRAFGSKIGGGD